MSYCRKGKATFSEDTRSDRKESFQHVTKAAWYHMDNPVQHQLLARPDMRRTSFTDCRTDLLHGLQLPRTTGSSQCRVAASKSAAARSANTVGEKKEHWMRLRVTGSRCILQLSAGAWASLRTFPYLFLRLYLVFISVCSSSLMRPVYKECMYVQYPRIPHSYDKHICCIHLLWPPKIFCFCHELIKKDLYRGYHPKDRCWKQETG